MDAVKFLKEKTRMCSSKDCDKCMLKTKNNGSDLNCISFIEKHPQTAVAVVKKWSAEHPIKTRQSEFLKMFPSADVTDGVLFICPRRVDLNCLSKEECREIICPECMKKYWLAKEE